MIVTRDMVDVGAGMPAAWCFFCTDMFFPNLAHSERPFSLCMQAQVISIRFSKKKSDLNSQPTTRVSAGEVRGRQLQQAKSLSMYAHT
jgi:hypothetical protein